MSPAWLSAQSGCCRAAVLMGVTVAWVIQACAQDAATQSSAPLWSGSVGFGHTSNALGAADDQSMTLRRVTDWGPVALEALQLRRSGQSDRAWALDAYPRLWDAAYANVRVQQAPQSLLYPGTSWRAEIYQGVGQGWELAASHDELRFDTPVQIQGVAVGKYWGNFYVRWRHQEVRSKGSSGQGERFMVRYYYQGDADHFLEATASSGRSDDFATTLITPSRSDTRGWAWLHFLNREWGLKASWSESKDNSSARGRERSFNLGLTRRW